jgi:UDP-N-acetylmuramoyl-L-alanyl-D-glutamate--2,6-diaminopimelate ligase
MKLSELLAGVTLREALTPELAGLEVAGLEYDSRRVEKDFVFFAFAGSRVDGRQFAQDALAKGALAIASELAKPAEFPGVWIQVEHGRQALAIAANTFYQHPDERVHFTGITGTNGKTTTAYLIETLLRAAAKITGLIGTIEYRLADEVRPSPNTTPESLDIIRFASELEARGGTHLITEVSSHALALGRVHGIQFHTAVFTNLTRDHLDFHGTMEDYGAAKRQLFAKKPGPRWAVLNADDPVSKTMQPEGSDSRTIWYGLTERADLRAENIVSGFTGLVFDVTFIREGAGRRAKVESPLLGRVNVSNILAALGAGLSYGLDFDSMARSVALCRAVPGRFEPVDEGQSFLVVVDYAHTDDALRNAIQTARSLAKGKVITLFGCGGDRDRTKRPLMGMAAAELSDFVVLTSDNPRSEDPLSIMNDAMVGLRRFDTRHVAQPDRGKAIQLAIQEAQPGDVVLLAGKGHETYQILKDHTIHFDDRETAREVLRSFGYRSQKTE